jgi:hypothetical protein
MGLEIKGMDCQEGAVSAKLFNELILHDLIAVFSNLLLHKGHFKISKPYLGRKTAVDILRVKRLFGNS